MLDRPLDPGLAKLLSSAWRTSPGRRRRRSAARWSAPASESAPRVASRSAAGL